MVWAKGARQGSRCGGKGQQGHGHHIGSTRDPSASPAQMLTGDDPWVAPSGSSGPNGPHRMPASGGRPAARAALAPSGPSELPCLDTALLAIDSRMLPRCALPPLSPRILCPAALRALREEQGVLAEALCYKRAASRCITVLVGIGIQLTTAGGRTELRKHCNASPHSHLPLPRIAPSPFRQRRGRAARVATLRCLATLASPGLDRVRERGVDGRELALQPLHLGQLCLGRLLLALQVGPGVTANTGEVSSPATTPHAPMGVHNWHACAPRISQQRTTHHGGSGPIPSRGGASGLSASAPTLQCPISRVLA